MTVRTMEPGLGDVVAPTALRMDPKALSVRVNAPQTPGRYRLTVMLHDKDGVAYDPNTQALLQPLGLKVVTYWDEPKLYLMVARKT